MECWDVDRAGVEGCVWMLVLHDLEEKIRFRNDQEDDKAFWVLGEETGESFRFFDG